MAYIKNLGIHICKVHADKARRGFQIWYHLNALEIEKTILRIEELLKSKQKHLYVHYMLIEKHISSVDTRMQDSLELRATNHWGITHR